MTENAHHDLGPYLLGGLSPTERRDFEAHLNECVDCRDELASSAGLPALLAQAPYEPAPEPRPESLAALLAAEAGYRRSGVRRRRLLAAVAGVALLTGGGVTGFAVRGSAPSDVAGTRVSIVAVGGSRVSGEITLVDKSWGSALTLTATGLPARGTFALRSVDATGRSQQTAVWSATSNGRVVVTGASSIHPDSQTLLSVVTSDGTVLATAKP